MKPRLVLYLTAESNPARSVIAATLSWATHAVDWYCEVYYDAYRLGEHYGGGDPSTLNAGQLTGGTMVGAQHHERLYLLLHRFDTLAVIQGSVAFDIALRQLGIPRIYAASAEEAYEQVFPALNLDLPRSAIIVDGAPHPRLRGLDAYSYPDIIGHRSLGFEAASLSDDTARWMMAHGVRTVQTLWLGPAQRQHVNDVLATARCGSDIGALDTSGDDESFLTITERLARRWKTQFDGGWILADPLTVAAWIPEAARQRRLAIYSKPQREIIQRLRTELQASASVVLGRQYEDADFFDLSALGLPFQLIDPGRPPFPVLRYAGYDWAPGTVSQSPYSSEPDNAQLTQWAREGRVLTSLIFWTGMLRELENLPRIVDLVALTRLKAGIALTVLAMEYQPEAPLELLRVPIEHGGVYPHLEVLLASCGEGAAIESLMPPGRLGAYLDAAQRRLDHLGVPAELRPTGWWSTMDPDMFPLPQRKLPVVPEVRRHAPFLRLRYAAAPTGSAAHTVQAMRADEKTDGAHAASARQRTAAWARRHGLAAALAPYRPYELYAPGDLRPDIIGAVRAAGLRYVFSKSGFGSPPHVLALYDDCVVMNYTAGRWDGWTPFETINDSGDLRSAERRLLARHQPGWLVGTLDSCLWTFTGPIWRRGAALYDIASFLAHGGDSGTLINVTPRVVARYARLVAERAY